jgi:hypothetical protein
VRRNLRIDETELRPGVLWLSRLRLSSRRRAYGERLLESALADHVTVFHPQEHPLAEQIAAIEAADVVAGVIGSAFHTLMMVERPPRCVYLAPGELPDGTPRPLLSNFVAQDRLLGNDSSFVPALTEVGPPSASRDGDPRRGAPRYRVSIPEALRGLLEACGTRR